MMRDGCEPPLPHSTPIHSSLRASSFERASSFGAVVSTINGHLSNLASQERISSTLPSLLHDAYEAAARAAANTAEGGGEGGEGAAAAAAPVAPAPATAVSQRGRKRTMSDLDSAGVRGAGGGGGGSGGGGLLLPSGRGGSKGSIATPKDGLHLLPAVQALQTAHARLSSAVTTGGFLSLLWQAVVDAVGPLPGGGGSGATGNSMGGSPPFNAGASSGAFASIALPAPVSSLPLSAAATIAGASSPTTPSGGGGGVDHSGSSLGEAEVYAYLPHEDDPLLRNALWSFNFLFINKRTHRALFLAGTARRSQPLPHLHGQPHLPDSSPARSGGGVGGGGGGAGGGGAAETTVQRHVVVDDGAASESFDGDAVEAEEDASSGEEEDDDERRGEGSTATPQALLIAEATSPRFRRPVILPSPSAASHDSRKGGGGKRGKNHS